MTQLGTLLRTRRAALGLTLQEVADGAGTTKSYVHDLEQGNHLNPGILLCTRLAVVLGLDIRGIAVAVLASAMKDQP